MLLLLYADPRGDLKTVLTIRAKTLNSCRFLSRDELEALANCVYIYIAVAGHAAFPGGKLID